MSPAGREPFTHRLKSWPEGFSAALTGRKRFELRRDDRTPRFESGDLVELREFDPFDPEGMLSGHARGYTGRRAMFFVGYVERASCLPSGWCGFDIVSPEDINRVSLAMSDATSNGVTK